MKFELRHFYRLKLFSLKQFGQFLNLISISTHWGNLENISNELISQVIKKLSAALLNFSEFTNNYTMPVDNASGGDW